MNNRPQKQDAIAARAVRPPTRIGDWVLHADSGILRSGTKERRLNAKTLHVLLVLLDSGDRGVSRDTLLDSVWGASYPSDFVVSRAISDLRAAFGEKAGEEKYLRTLPKFGYQLVAATSAVSTTEATADSKSPSIPHTRLFLAAIAVLGIAALIYQSTTQTPQSAAGHELNLPAHRPLTSAPGTENQPRFVSGTQWIVYAALRPGRPDWDIFRVSRDDNLSEPVAVTPNVHEHGPAASPSGDQLAYVRLSDDDCKVVVQSLVLGVPAPIADCTRKFPTVVDWSPNGDYIAYTAAQDDDVNSLRRIYSVQLSGGAAIRLTTAVSNSGTDFYPRFSPSGEQLAFLRGEPQPDHRATLWVVNVITKRESALTTLPAQLGGMTWIDEQTLLYSYSDAGVMRSHIISLQTGEERVISAPGLVHPDYDATSDTLAAAQLRRNRELILVNENGETRTIAASTSDDHHASLRHDESWVAFVSGRSGTDELWMAATGSDAVRRLTRLEEAAVRYPDWHPDGQHIIFTAQSDGGELLFQIDIVSGIAEQISTPFAALTTPKWMPDGERWVAGCHSGDSWGICTGNGTDARRIAEGYFRPTPLSAEEVAVVDQRGVLFRLHLDTGKLLEVWDGLPLHGRGAWTISGDKVLFLAGSNEVSAARLLSYDLSAAQIEQIFEDNMALTDSSLSIGRLTGSMLISRYRSASDDLILIENTDFRRL